MEEYPYKPPLAPLSEIQRPPQPEARTFRTRVIPATVCFFAGVLLALMSLFVGIIAIRGLMSPDPDGLKHSFEPTRLSIACGFGTSAWLFIDAGRSLISGVWRRAIKLIVGGIVVIFAAVGISLFLQEQALAKLRHSGSPTPRQAGLIS